MAEIHEYLGDGVYATYDGWGIWLKANSHLNPTDKIYLEPSVFKALSQFKSLCDYKKSRHIKED